ncbi:hypothetical protein SELMODRAFT_97920 [Selaginella moellendorffii]|uniref:Pentacotripeptide-repeat region of PRORP domain-containing protein n=1 Tax=Selaginella moellendorffii TaxID=88036 RepID=D8RNJ8_SELML|nr:hypothetical protein SELMODRAFT_97920 [Selaginella moellendorffii]
MFGKCGSVAEARKIYDKVEDPGVHGNTIMLTAYTQNGYLREAKEMFDSMRDKGVVSWTSMVSGFAEHSRLREASDFFDKMPQWNVVTWNALLTGYARHGHLDEACSMFQVMPQLNLTSWTTVVSSLCQHGRLDEARILFERIPQWNTLSWNYMIQGYAKGRRLEDAKQLFDRMPYRDAASMPERDIVSWTAALQGFGEQGYVETATKMFQAMPLRDTIAWSAVMQALGENGHLEEAKRLFDSMPEPDSVDVVSWNMIIHGYAQSGQGDCGMLVFQAMVLDGTRPDNVTFTGVLLTCNHVGLLSQGEVMFVSMVEDHGLVPGVEHFNLLIDNLGRCGQLQRAEDVLHTMPYEADPLTWTTFLNLCKVHGDLKRAELAAERVVKLQPESSAPYVLLYNIYAVPDEKRKHGLLSRLSRKQRSKISAGSRLHDSGPRERSLGDIS